MWPKLVSIHLRRTIKTAKACTVTVKKMLFPKSRVLMIAIVHQTESMAQPVIPCFCIRQYFQKFSSVLVLQENGLPGIPTGSKGSNGKGSKEVMK
jgi:hypothetical protein